MQTVTKGLRIVSLHDRSAILATYERLVSIKKANWAALPVSLYLR